MVTKIRCSGNRSLKDIAFEHYGKMEGVLEILKLNPKLQITDVPKAGDLIFVKVNEDKNKVVNQYKNDDYRPSTGSNLFVFPHIFDDTFGSVFN
ncbi:MAG: hypothetical protein EAZ27_04460 [Cytophagales bacterium]|nr:MAG: hypothetical protein EAZ27_04460 [Cytophagales bacterium]